MKMIDTFSKLTLSDLTIPSQNMYKGWGCQASDNMTLKSLKRFSRSLKTGTLSF